MNWADRSYPGSRPEADSRYRVAIHRSARWKRTVHAGRDRRGSPRRWRAGRDRLAQAGVPALVLPAIAYAAAPFAGGFGGTLSIRPETTRALLLDLATQPSRGAVSPSSRSPTPTLDPANVAVLRATVDEIDSAGAVHTSSFPTAPRVHWPDGSVTSSAPAPVTPGALRGRRSCSPNAPIWSGRRSAAPCAKSVGRWSKRRDSVGRASPFAGLDEACCTAICRGDRPKGEIVLTGSSGRSLPRRCAPP
ncbi:MAG: hypothetical protein R2862_10805 [Thermoanaerobaculia bacterium]